MARATLTISSKNYSSWSLRGWLLCRMAGLDFEEQPVDLDDPDARQELLLLSPSVLVPRLTHDGVAVWDTLAIAEYLNEIAPEAGLLPADRAARAHCRVGLRRDPFGLLQPALGAADEPQGAAHERSRSSPAPGPTSSGSRRSGASASTPMAGRSCSATPSVADAMYAPVCTRFRTYAVALEPALAALLRDDLRLAADAGMDRGRARRARRDRRARGGVLEPLRLDRPASQPCRRRLAP